MNLHSTAIATFDGAITGSETFTIANSAKSVMTIPVSGTGSFNLANGGSLEFGAADSESVTFAAGANGTLKLDHSLTTPFTGQISGLTAKNAVDLADLPFTKGNMSALYSGTATGGMLTVTNGSTKQSVSLNLLGDYRTASWTLSQDSSKTGTLIVDPPVSGSLIPDANGIESGVDLFDISFGSDTPLAYWAGDESMGGRATAGDSSHSTSLALLRQYSASSFVSQGHGGTPITEPTANQATWLTVPHG